MNQPASVFLLPIRRTTAIRVKAARVKPGENLKITKLEPGTANAKPVSREALDEFRRRKLTAAERREFDDYLNVSRYEIERADAEKRQLNRIAANRARLHPEDESSTGLIGGRRPSKLPPEIIELAGRKELSVTSASGAGIRTKPPVDRGAPLQLHGILGRVAELWQGDLSRRYIGWIMREEYPGMDFTLSDIRKMIESVRRKAARTKRAVEIEVSKET
jgi:hypothetical protein